MGKGATRSRAGIMPLPLSTGVLGDGSGLLGTSGLGHWMGGHGSGQGHGVSGQDGVGGQTPGGRGVPVPGRGVPGRGVPGRGVPGRGVSSG